MKQCDNERPDPMTCAHRTVGRQTRAPHAGGGVAQNIRGVFGGTGGEDGGVGLVCSCV